MHRLGLLLDGHRELERLLAQQREHALAAVEHVAVEEGLGEQVVVLVRRADALVHILRGQVLVHGGLQPQRWRAPAHAADEALFGGVQGIDHPAVVQGQCHAAALQVFVAHGLQQQGLEAQVFAQHGVQLG